MSVFNDFDLRDKEKFGGILELEDGERGHCEATEPTETLVPEIRKGDVLVARMRTGDGWYRDEERPLKVLAIRIFHDEPIKYIFDVIDVLDGEKGTLSLQIRGRVTTIRVQRHKYTIQGWCGPEDFDHMPYLLLRRDLGDGFCVDMRFKMPEGQLGRELRAYRRFAEGRRDSVTLVMINCLGEYRLVALGVGDVN
ncbi:hypothetical protein N7G274_007432 [Stereocaulon virgatum]|uniref:Uncharacterized protein n=1 Tax=Stereocaulon virgatum TaxID=373712 RepID=A0ABR4A3E6_9LECA